jgi:hypothetical protein
MRGNIFKWMAIFSLGFMVFTPGKEKESLLKQTMIDEFCTSQDAITKYKVLGYLQGYDSIDKRTYGFLIYLKKMITKDDYEINIKSNVFEGVSLLGEEAATRAREVYNQEQEYFTSGTPMLIMEKGDKRKIEYRIYQKDGEPDTIEIFLVTRDKKGRPRKPLTVKVPWPKAGKKETINQQPGAPPFVKISLIKKHCPPKDTNIAYSQLGYIDAYDGIINQYYAFIVFKEINRRGNLTTLGIGGNIATGITLSNERGQKLAAQAHKEGMPFATVGNPIPPLAEGDPRTVQYRILQEDGQPTELEIFIVTRDNTGKAKEPKSLKVKWPFSVNKKSKKKK